MKDKNGFIVFSFFFPNGNVLLHVTNTSHVELALKVSGCAWVGSRDSSATGVLKKGKMLSVMEYFNQCRVLKEPEVVLLLAVFETSRAFHDITSFPYLNQWLILLACLFLFLAASGNSKLHVSIFSLMSHTSLPEVTVHSPMCFSVLFFFSPF